MPFDSPQSTLADVIAKLEQLPTLGDTRRRDLISAVNRAATYLNRPPADLPTDVPALRALLATIHPVQAGVSAKSLSNVRTNLATALRITRFTPRDLPKMERTPAWIGFLDHVSGDHQIYTLSRFVGFCCDRRIEPDDVTDAVLARFGEHMSVRSLVKDPAKRCKEITQTWNGIVKRNALPLTVLTAAPNPQYRCRALKEYPVNLQDEVSGYLKRRSVVDLFDENGPDQALRPTSLRNTEAHLRQYFDALANAGRDPAKMGSLASTVSADNMKMAFKAHIDRTGTTLRSGSLQNIAATLVVVARDHLKVSPGDLEAMLKVKKRVSVNPKGMTVKNSQRLMQFNDWENVARLVALPDVLMNRAKAGPTNRTTALLAMHAVTISILLSCPMRIKNLASLDIDRHLIAHRSGNHTRYSIRIEGEEVKNREPIEVQLSGSNSAILHRYITSYRNELTGAQSSALFPKASDGASRSPGNFSSDLAALIYRETGLVMNAHLFRHWAAKIFLDAHPGQYETVRRLLKHKKVQTTIDFYAELSSQHAHDSYSAILTKFGGHDD